MLRFDELGHLVPYAISEMTLEAFRSFFVEELADQSHRQTLFEQYLKFADAVTNNFGLPFHQWIAGSFVTRKEFPGDMDVVTFLPYETMLKKATRVQFFKTEARELYQIDASFSPVCKWNHRFFEASQMWETDFLELYGTSRPDQHLKKHPKGIIKITFAP